MSATAETFKLCDYFSEYYGPPQNKYICPPNINVSKVHNYNIVTFYLEDLFGVIPSVSTSLFMYIYIYIITYKQGSEL